MSTRLAVFEEKLGDALYVGTWYEWTSDSVEFSVTTAELDHQGYQKGAGITMSAADARKLAEALLRAARQVVGEQR